MQVDQLELDTLCCVLCIEHCEQTHLLGDGLKPKWNLEWVCIWEARYGDKENPRKSEALTLGDWEVAAFKK